MTKTLLALRPANYVGHAPVFATTTRQSLDAHNLRHRLLQDVVPR